MLSDLYKTVRPRSSEAALRVHSRPAHPVARSSPWLQTGTIAETIVAGLTRGGSAIRTRGALAQTFSSRLSVQASIDWYGYVACDGSGRVRSTDEDAHRHGAAHVDGTEDRGTVALEENPERR